MPGPLEIDQPDWPELLRAVQDNLANRLHTSLPGIVVSYDVATQTAEVQLAVQLLGNTVPPLAEVPVLWPGGAAGHLHVPLAAGDTVMVLFGEEDFSGWWDTGSISAPRVLARHGLHAVAIPGLRRAAAPLAVTSGHVTLASAAALHLGSDTATAFVALAPPVNAALTQLKTALDALVLTLNGVAPGVQAAWNTAMAGWQPDPTATKVKAV